MVDGSGYVTELEHTIDDGSDTAAFQSREQALQLGSSSGAGRDAGHTRAAACGADNRTAFGHRRQLSALMRAIQDTGDRRRQRLHRDVAVQNRDVISAKTPAELGLRFSVHCNANGVSLVHCFGDLDGDGPDAASAACNQDVTSSMETPGVESLNHRRAHQCRRCRFRERQIVRHPGALPHVHNNVFLK